MMTSYQRLIIACTALMLMSCGGSPPGKAPASDADRLNRIDTVYLEYRADFPEVNEITPQGVLDFQQAEETILVDVRTAEEQAVSMLPGAITLEAFEAARDVYQNKTIVTYCTIGARSGQCADKLRREGLEVFNLKGSILAWTHAGLPLVDSEGRDTKKLHTYGEKWDLAADGYETEW